MLPRKLPQSYNGQEFKPNMQLFQESQLGASWVLPSGHESMNDHWESSPVQAKRTQDHIHCVSYTVKSRVRVNVCL